MPDREVISHFLRLQESALPANGRFLVVGDIHGELQLFERLLQLAGFDPARDHVLSLGDLIDRGPNSADVLDWFLHGERRSALLGNHEAMMIVARDDVAVRELWFRNGGLWVLQIGDQRHRAYAEAVHRFPLAIELQLCDGRRIGLVHAEVKPGLHWREIRDVQFVAEDAIDISALAPMPSLLWGRQRLSAVLDADVRRGPPRLAIDACVPGIDQLIAGHTILYRREPLSHGNCLWIETGAFQQRQGGRLTLVDPAAACYWQVGARSTDRWGPSPLPVPTPTMI